jgi:hypothetical protein
MHNLKPTKKPLTTFVILKDIFLSQFEALEIAIRLATTHKAFLCPGDNLRYKK